MKRWFILAALFMGSPAYAYLTSDVDASAGYTSFSIQTAGNTFNLTSLTTINFSYNLNYQAWNTALHMQMSEAANSNQGALAWTRLALGFRYYPAGFNAQRVIFDNKVEGYYWRPAPYIGLNAGMSTITLSSVGGGAGYFNAADIDYGVAIGAEVTLSTSVFLTGQLTFLQGLATQNAKSGYDMKYSATGVYFGLKVITF